MYIYNVHTIVPSLLGLHHSYNYQVAVRKSLDPTQAYDCVFESVMYTFSVFIESVMYTFSYIFSKSFISCLGCWA